MSERFMPKQRAIEIHLSLGLVGEGVEIFSGFRQGLKESRLATTRDPNSGVKRTDDGHTSWVGALGYMALLNQIGNCFRPQGKPPVQGNSITKALRYFTTLTNPEIDAIYALRCAFAHDFALYNINRKKIGLTHCFRIRGGASGPIIKLPHQPWSGDYQDKPSDVHTEINLELLGDLVEDICRRLVLEAKAGTLDVTLQNGSDELLQRYGYYRSARPPA